MSEIKSNQTEGLHRRRSGPGALFYCCATGVNAWSGTRKGKPAPVLVEPQAETESAETKSKEKDTRRLIVDVAERLYRQIGFQKTTVVDIARELHMLCLCLRGVAR
jgi:hypothetical protein